MASLDKMEGEAVEGVILLLVGLVALAAWQIYKTFGKFDAAGAFSQAWKQFLSGLSVLKGAFSLPAPGAASAGGPDWVQTGSNLGASADDYNSKLLASVAAGNMTLGEYADYAPGGRYASYEGY